ncbi:MAG: hypothetical protein KGL35_10200 [Bradyrhizobium sp.]|nr:hypothetical protein [Bradyrhizobium sp.]
MKGKYRARAENRDQRRAHQRAEMERQEAEQLLLQIARLDAEAAQLGDLARNTHARMRFLSDKDAKVAALTRERADALLSETLRLEGENSQRRVALKEFARTFLRDFEDYQKPWKRSRLNPDDRFSSRAVDAVNQIRCVKSPGPLETKDSLRRAWQNGHKDAPPEDDNSATGRHAGG